MNVYKYLRWLSLDIVLGAIFFLYYLNNYYNLKLEWVVYAELGLAVWAIYLLDHILDAKRKSHFHSPRHQFYKRVYSKLIVLNVVVIASGLALLFLLPTPILLNGVYLSAFSFLYLVLVKYNANFWIKEVLIAIGYSLGLFLVPFTFIEQVGLVDILFFFCVFLIAFCNLILFSIFDFEQDVSDQFPSLVRRLGIRRSEMLLNLILILTILISLILVYQTFFLGILLLTMTFVLGALYLLPRRFIRKDYFRAIGDGVFFLPLIFALIG